MNLFISQPMNGKSVEEIQKIKEDAIEEVKIMFGEKFKVIDSSIKEDPPKNISDDAKGIWYLGRSLLLMSKADVVYFAKGWRKSRGCILENAIALEYNLCCVQTD